MPLSFGSLDGVFSMVCGKRGSDTCTLPSDEERLPLYRNVAAHTVVTVFILSPSGNGTPFQGAVE